jgi:predicted phage terminase large subunit-like protein
MTTAHDQTLLVRAILRQDFYSFVQAAFPIVSPGDTFLINWHLEAIAYALDRIRTGECNRLIITVPPRTLKSIMTSVALPAFVLGHDPTRKIICVSYSEGLARKHANDCRALMRHPLYQRVFPNTRISALKDTELELATTAGGFRLSTSVGGTLTGRGGNLVIIDDPLKPQDAHSSVARENLRQWYGNTLLSRLNNKSDDAIIIVMQRLHMDDLVGHVLGGGDWEQVNLPAIALCDQTIPLGPGRLHHRRVGDVLHAARESAFELERLRGEMGSMDFSAQYQQEPVPESGNLIKWDWFGRYKEAVPVVATDHILVSWDTAMSARELADYSACVVLHLKGESAFIVDVLRERLEYPDLKRKVLDRHWRWKNANTRYSLLIENKGSGMSLIQELKRDGVHAIAINPEGDKVMRMTAQTSRIESGGVYLPHAAPWLEDFRTELMAFPAGRHNDQVDALSQALQYASELQARRVWVGTYRGCF